MTEKISEKMLNGVDVQQVEDAITLFEDKPKMATFKFRIYNKWVNGGHNHSSVKDFFGVDEEHPHPTTFEVDSDEPTVLAGTEKAANPTEYLLHAMAGCMTSTLVYHAAVRGIKIDELESHLEGDIDLRGFMGLSDKVRKGFENIRMNFKVKTDAENLEKLKELSKFSPVFDSVSRGTNVDVQIEGK